MDQWNAVAIQVLIMSGGVVFLFGIPLFVRHRIRRWRGRSKDHTTRN